MKRYYKENQSIKYKDYDINITPTGSAYWNDNRTMKKLDSFFFPKSRSLSISLPDGKEIRVRNIKGKLEVKDENI